MLTVFSLFLGCVAEPVLAEGTALQVMSFNIRYGTANDGPNAWDLRRELLVDTIRGHHPDVFGTQECLEFQAEYIAEQLPEYRWVGMGRDADGTGEMTAVFYRKALLAPVELEHFWLSERPEEPGSVSWDSSLTRMATRLKFYHCGARQYFTVFNTHFDHRGVQAREESAALLARRAGALAEDHPVIVMGDFNSAAESTKPWETLTSTGLQDSWLAAQEKSGPQTTWGGFGKPGEHRIDWILVRGPVAVDRAEIVTRNEDGRYPSDHYPVTATLRLWPGKG